MKLIIWLKRLIHKRFVRSTFTLILGTSIAQCLLIITSPILSRLYDPTAFGVFGVFVSITTVIFAVSTWRYELAIVLPEKEEDAACLVVLSCAVTILMSVTAAFFVLFFGRWVSEKIGNTGLYAILWLAPISILLMGVYQILNYWFTRRRLFTSISIAQVSRSGTNIFVQIIAGLKNLGSGGLVLGQIMGQAISAGFLLIKFLSEDTRYFVNIKTDRIKDVALKYVSFPKYNSLQAVINALSQNAPIFLLGYFFGVIPAGLYALTYKVLSMPLNLIGESFRQVFFQKASEDHNKGVDIYRLLIKSTVTLGMISAPIFFTIILFGPQIFSFVFGRSWYVSGVYARWVSVWVFFGLVNIPSVMIAQIFLLQRLLLIYELVLLSRVAVFWLGGRYVDAGFAVASYCVTGAVFNIALIAIIIPIVRKKRKKFLYAQ